MVHKRKKSRNPRFFEKKYIDCEEQAIRNSSLVISLFSIPYAYLKKRFPQANIIYSKINVINSFYDGVLEPNNIIEKKNKSKNILFIGGRHYIKGARLLISAFNILHKNDPQIHLDIIGIPQEAFKEKWEGVTAHGYLSRENHSERGKYYELLLNAKVYCNPSVRWGAYSSCVESLFFYTPCVINAYDEFVNQFGTDIAFGKYVNDEDVLSLCNVLKEILYGNNYEYMAKQSHEAVKYFTWDNYIDWIMGQLNASNAQCVLR